MLLVTKLPPIANATLPTLPELKYGFEWFRGSKTYARRIYQRARLKVVEAGAGFRDRFAVECFPGDLTLLGKERTDDQYGRMGDVRVLRTSGTTGRKKRYLWGPHFIEVNKFYFGLTREGDRLHRTVRVSLGEFRDVGKDSDFVVTELPYDFIGYTKNVTVNVRGKGEVKGLGDVLAGYNVSLFPTAWGLLEPSIGLSRSIDPAAVVCFTGEAMPPGTLLELRGRGIDARDSMRAWDGGATFFTCRYGNRHWCDFLSTVDLDVDGTLRNSDLYNLTQPHVNYANGDVVESKELGRCQCGLESVSIEFASRQDTIYFGTPSGHRCNYDGLSSLLDRAARQHGVTIEIACFGCDVGGTQPLRVDYGAVGSDGGIRAFERAASLLYREEYGFRKVELHSGLDRFSTKCKKMFYYVKE
jgi:hypothetical protein